MLWSFMRTQLKYGTIIMNPVIKPTTTMSRHSRPRMNLLLMVRRPVWWSKATVDRTIPSALYGKYL